MGARAVISPREHSDLYPLQRKVPGGSTIDARICSCADQDIRDQCTQGTRTLQGRPRPKEQTRSNGPRNLKKMVRLRPQPTTSGGHGQQSCATEEISTG